jgi:pimeloyl-ACP methyl ester carboxylesterase
MQTHLVQVGAHRVRVLEAGKGSAVVLLHGIGRSLEDWSENIEALARHHRVIAPDLLGFGLSDKPKLNYTVPLERDFLRDMFQVLKIERASLIGSSMGGAIAVAFALEYPQLTQKLVLVAPAGMGKRGADFLGLCTVPVLGELIARPSKIGARNICKSLFHDPTFVTETRVARDHELSKEPGAGRVFLSMLRSMAVRSGLRPELLEMIRGNLERVKAPSMVVWGRQDQILFETYAASAAQGLNARLEIFEACGHFPMLEMSERFNALVVEFLAV